MRFSIQEQNGKKMFFHVPAAANKVTGLHLTTIKTILERGGNPIYHRKSDNKLFEIRKEDPIKLLVIEGEDFFSLEEIQAKFNLSPTKFLNQVKNDKFAKKIDWISPELFPGNESETEKIDELEILREEMRSQFEKFQAEMRSQFEKYQAEIDRLSAKVETLEKEKASLPPQGAKLPGELRSQEAKPKVFNPPRTFDSSSFSLQSLAKFIRNGLVGVRSDGPKTHRYVLVNDKREYLPDLVKQIIQEDILPTLEYGSEEERKRTIEEISDTFNSKTVGMSTGAFFALRGKIRRLEETTIMEVTKEVMKLI